MKQNDEEKTFKVLKRSDINDLCQEISNYLRNAYLMPDYNELAVANPEQSAVFHYIQKKNDIRDIIDKNNWTSEDLFIELSRRNARLIIDRLNNKCKIDQSDIDKIKTVFPDIKITQGEIKE